MLGASAGSSVAPGGMELGSLFAITASPFERGEGRGKRGALRTPAEPPGSIPCFGRGRRLSACSLAVAHLQFDGV